MYLVNTTRLCDVTYRKESAAHTRATNTPAGLIIPQCVFRSIQVDPSDDAPHRHWTREEIMQEGMAIPEEVVGDGSPRTPGHDRIGNHRRATQQVKEATVLTPKPDVSIWFCIDFRRINAISRFDACPLPQVNALRSKTASRWVHIHAQLDEGF